MNAEICRFHSFPNWVNKASSWLYGYKSSQIVCLDSKGRICEIGSDFKRADEENSFPVIVYEVSNKKP